MVNIRKLQKVFLLLGVAFILGLGLLILNRSSKVSQTARIIDEREKESKAMDDDSSQIQLREFRRVEVKDGKKLWEVNAKDARYFSDDGTTHVDDASLEIFREDGGNVKIRAKTAKLVLAAEAMEKADLEGNIEVVLDNETSLTAEYATFDSKEGRIEAPGDVKIKGVGYEISGSGFEMEVEKRNFFFRNNVRSRFDQGLDIAKGLEG